MRGKKPASEAMPPVFGLPPAIQKMSREAGQRLRGGVRVGRLGVVDEQHAALAADLLHAVREAGKRAQSLLDRRLDRPSASAAPVAQAAFCALCTPRSEPMPPSSAIGARAAARGLHDLLGLDVEAVGERPAHRDAHHALAGALDAIGGGLAPVVVDADDRGAVRLHAGDQPLLDGRVVRERAVAVEMILA